jgi:protease-4
MYGRFLSIVAAARHKTPQQVDQIAQGRVWDGGTAHQIGLVDGFGGMQEAVAKAAQLANLGPNDRGLRYLEPPKSFRDQLIETLADQADDSTAAQPDAFAAIAQRPQQQLAQALYDVRAILGGSSIQATCLECAAAAPAPALKTRDISLLTMLKEWLF